MAQKTYSLNIDVNTATLGQLESELEQINQELKNVDRNSDAFDQLTKSAQQVTKEIDKTNQAIEGMTLDKKLEAADGAAKLFGGSLASAVGTLGLLGVESEVFGEFEEKAASAISVGLGIKDVSEGFSKLTKTVKLQTVAQKALNVVQRVFNAIMSANPVALVIISITTLIGLVVSLKDRFEAVNKVFQFFKGLVTSAAEALGLAATEEEKAAERQKAATEQRLLDLDNEIKVRKAAGEETVELEREKLQKIISLQEEGSQELKNAQADLDAFEAGLIKEKNDREAKAAEERKKKREEEQKKAAEQAKADAEKAKKDAEQYEKDKAAAVKAIRDAEAVTEEQQRELEKVKLQEEYAEKIALAKQFGIDTTALVAAQREAEQLLQDQFDAEDAARDKERTDRERQEAEDRVANAIAAKEAQVAIENAKWGLLAQAANLAQEIAGENEAVAIGAVIATQAAAIGQIVASTGLANAKAVAASPLTFGQPWVTINTISAGLSIATAIAQARKSIQEIKSGSGGGGAPSGGRPSLPGGRGAGVSAPQTTPTNQSVNIGNIEEVQQASATPTVKAYMLSGDARSAQEADAKLERRRTLD